MSEDSSPQFPINIDRTHFPEPEWTFPNVEINTYAKDSKPDFPPVNRGVFEFNGSIEHVKLEFGDFDEPSGMDRLELATKME